MFDAGVLAVLRRHLGGGRDDDHGEGAVGGDTSPDDPRNRDSHATSASLSAAWIGDMLLLVSVLMPALPADGTTEADALVQLEASTSSPVVPPASTASGPGEETRSTPAAAAMWNCSVCTFANEPSAWNCSMCGTSNPSPAAAPTHSDAASPWSCPRCTYTNAPTMAHCEMCSAPNPCPAPPSSGSKEPTHGDSPGAAVFTSPPLEQRTLAEVLGSRRGDMESIGDQLLEPLLRVASQAVDDTVRYRVLHALTSFAHFCPVSTLSSLLSTLAHELPSVVACT